jgi:hypothetical protein
MYIIFGFLNLATKIKFSFKYPDLQYVVKYKLSYILNFAELKLSVLINFAQDIYWCDINLCNFLACVRVKVSPCTCIHSTSIITKLVDFHSK